MKDKIKDKIKNKNIILIGMPGVGKSTLSKELSKKLNLKLIDVDKKIEEKENKKLQEIKDKEGEKEFLKIEEKTLLNILPVEKSIIDCGGSIVYSDKLMKSLKKNSIIIFLDLPLKEIDKNTRGNRNNRGIVGLKSKSLKKIYQER